MFFYVIEKSLKSQKRYKTFQLNWYFYKQKNKYFFYPFCFFFIFIIVHKVSQLTFLRKTSIIIDTRLINYEVQYNIVACFVIINV